HCPASIPALIPRHEQHCEVRLPKRQPPSGDVQPAKKVLLAENDHETRVAIHNALSKAGYEVTVVNDGARALARIRKTSFDLAFLDIWMREMSALDVIARTRKGTRHPKIIIMTSEGASEGLLHAVREQAYEYLCKPFPAHEAV